MGDRAVARVDIHLLADGRLVCRVEGQVPQLLVLGMFEKAKADLMALWAKQAAETGIAIPSPGLVSRLNGKG